MPRIDVQVNMFPALWLLEDGSHCGGTWCTWGNCWGLLLLYNPELLLHGGAALFQQDDPCGHLLPGLLHLILHLVSTVLHPLSLLFQLVHIIFNPFHTILEGINAVFLFLLGQALFVEQLAWGLTLLKLLGAFAPPLATLVVTLAVAALAAACGQT